MFTVEFHKIYQIFLINYYNNSNSSNIIAEFETFYCKVQ